MALINYGPYRTPISWPRPTQDDSSQILLRGMLADKQQQIARHTQLNQILTALDPVTFLNDANKLEQTKRIDELEKYATDLNKKRRGRLSQQDLMDLQWKVEKFNEWQSQAQQGIKKLAMETEIFNKHPDMYDPVAYNAAVYQFINDKDGLAPASFLEIKAKDLIGDMKQLYLFQPQGKGQSTKKVTKRIIDGAPKDVTEMEMRYGIYDPATGGIDDKATNEYLNQALLSMIANDSGYLQFAKKAFAALAPDDPLRTKYQLMAAQYTMSSNAQQAKDKIIGEERKYPKEISAELFYARDLAKKVVPLRESSYEENLESSGMQEARYKEAHKETEKETEANNKLTLSAEGDNVTVDGFVQNYNKKGEISNNDGLETVVPVQYKVTKIDNVPLSKGQKFQIDGRSVITAVPSDSPMYEEDPYGHFASDVESAIGRNLEISKAQILYNVPIYIGELPLDVENEGRHYKFNKNQPLSTQELDMLKKYSDRNDVDLSSLVQENNRDFARLTLDLGSLGGIKGTVVVLRELSDGYVEDILNLKDRGYVSRFKPVAEEEQPEVKKEQKEWFGKKLWKKLTERPNDPAGIF